MMLVRCWCCRGDSLRAVIQNSDVAVTGTTCALRGINGRQVDIVLLNKNLSNKGLFIIHKNFDVLLVQLLLGRSCSCGLFSTPHLTSALFRSSAALSHIFTLIGCLCGRGLSAPRRCRARFFFKRWF
ncbi:hypothetical protein NL108_017534 [Boleophthalmus pectinirostris]|nr:hypothetical protein NL108_017534 [Boleophthalmus pectinirostris]